MPDFLVLRPNSLAALSEEGLRVQLLASASPGGTE